MAKQAERSAATRSKILGSARTLFVTVGYEATTTSMILAASGVSRGAMYYHFESKEAIFEQLYLETGREVMAASARSDGHAEPIERAVAWLKEASRPDAAAMLFELGPAVLGWRRCRELETEHDLTPGRTLVETAALWVRLPPGTTAIAAAMVSAALGEAALVLAHTQGPSPSVEDVRAILAGLLG